MDIKICNKVLERYNLEPFIIWPSIWVSKENNTSTYINTHIHIQKHAERQIQRIFTIQNYMANVYNTQSQNGGGEIERIQSAMVEWPYPRIYY